MGWFQDNADALEKAGISEAEAQSFIERNPGDEHRLIEALTNDTSDRLYDSQDTSKYDTHGNYIGGPVGSMSNYGSFKSTPGYGNAMNGGGLPQVPYTPFTRTFSPSLGAFPADLMQPLTDSYTAPTMPADLMDKWDKTFTAPDVNQIADNPLVKARVSLGMDAIQRGAAARGTLLTPGVQMGIADYAGKVGSEEYANIYNRANQEFLDAYGIFTGDKTRRQGVWNDQFSQGLGTFQANTGLKLADRAQRAGFYGDQTGREMSQFGQDYTIARNNQLDPFGMGVQTYQLGQDDRRIGQTDRSLSQADRALEENLTMGAFNRNRTNTLDDFSMWHTLDSDFYDRLFRQAQLGRPSS